MKVEFAESKKCPFKDFNCNTKECIAWVTTADGKKEIDKITEPYDMTPGDISRWVDNKKRDGYENIGREGGFRDKYVKYEHTNEGYCNMIPERNITKSS